MTDREAWAWFMVFVLFCLTVFYGAKGTRETVRLAACEAKLSSADALSRTQADVFLQNEQTIWMLESEIKALEYWQSDMDTQLEEARQRVLHAEAGLGCW